MPFLSDVSQPYLFYARRYDLDLRLIPVRGGHGINITVTDDREVRDIAGDRKSRRDATLGVVFKQAIRRTLLEEKTELFDSERDRYFSGGGQIEGFKFGLTVRRLFDPHEVTVGASYRRASSVLGELSEIYAVTVGARLRMVAKGELRSSLELYRQTLSNLEGSPSFQLTDNKSGRRGAVWSVDMRYGLRGGMRVNFSLTGRHADDRSGRVSGRGDMIVEF